MENMNVRRATMAEIDWIVGLSQRVQDALTASGSLQHIGPLPHTMVETSVRADSAYILVSPEHLPDHRLGSVLVDLLTPASPVSLERWGLADLEEPLWYLHAFMLEPAIQGRGLGAIFLEGVKRLVLPHLSGTIILDCWAGNRKLRAFYQRNGFTFHGVFSSKLGDYEVAVFLYP